MMDHDEIKTKTQVANLQPDNTLSSHHGDTVNGLEQPKQRKLILHFDVRNTILVADSVTNVCVEHAMNSYLTGVTWGEETSQGSWKWLSDKPSLTPPTSDAMTYYRHKELQIVRKASDRGRLRQATGTFTSEEIGKMFLPQFKKHMEYLEWNHGADQRLTMAGQDGKLYHYILPAFFKLICQLQQDGRDFAVIIRTYGMDAPNVLQAILQTCKGFHPDFAATLPLFINLWPGKISRPENDAFVLEQHNAVRRCSSVSNSVDDITLDDGNASAINAASLAQRPMSAQVSNNASNHRPTLGSRGRVYRMEKEIYTLLSEANGVQAFVDDFQFWQNNDYSHKAGKPLWIDPGDSTVQHILFDDNIRVWEDDSIADVRVLNHNTGMGQSVTQAQAKELLDTCLVQADLLESTANINYFIDKVKLCEDNYRIKLAQWPI